MYAIIDNGNKQYKVAEGDVVRVEKLAVNEGESVEFKVLMVSDENGIKVGADVANAKVTATVVKQDKAIGGKGKAVRQLDIELHSDDISRVVEHDR